MHPVYVPWILYTTTCTPMQRPTLENVRIRSPRDALVVFHGVALKILPLITRRLDIEERRAIVAGNVYVWEERGVNTETVGLGMERWTDGMGWGPSRVRDEFLFYHQKNPDDDCGPITQSPPWARLTRNGESSHFPGYSVSSTFRTLPETRNLIKQTYSVHVSLPADRPKGITRKWHLTAYFSQDTLESLQTVESIQGIGGMLPPEGWFRSARTTKTSRRDSPKSPTCSPPSPHNLTRPYPSGSNYPKEAPLSHTLSTPLTYPKRTMLVPLEHLQSASSPRRNPVDEQLLNLFSKRC
ncbi:Gti1/Pac2 family-domain-containing protein [Desarmillaria ectypa]|nr:Gti1/Pac2 family-domain-containing protein [Desarmillaria ectypa]